MTHKLTTVGSALGGNTVALAHEASDLLLAREVTDDHFAAMAAGISIEPGERYAVQRGVAVVPVRGLLTPNAFVYERYFGWTTYQGLEQTAAILEAHEDVGAIVLDMNCAGGMVLGIDGAAQAIARLAATKPVHVIVHPMAASAAYWLASQGTDITMTPGSEVGCIGTRMMAMAEVQASVHGHQFFNISSSHARAKKPDPSTEEGMTELRRSLDESEAAFHQAVAIGRGIDLAELPQLLSVTDDPRDGGAMFGTEAAVARRLADSVQSYDAFYEAVMARYAPVPRTPGKGAVALVAAAKARAQI